MAAMKKKIGPSFASELQAAGLQQLVAWTEDGDVFFGDLLSAQARSAVLALLSKHDPEAPAPASVPAAVSRYQGREAMRLTPYGEPGTGVSVFDAAVALLNRPDTPPYYLRAWEELQDFEFGSPMLVAVADELGLTHADRVALFLFAAPLKA